MDSFDWHCEPDDQKHYMIYQQNGINKINSGHSTTRNFNCWKGSPNLPGFEPGIFWSVVRRVIHCATGPYKVLPGWMLFKGKKSIRTYQDSNLESSDPKSDALSIAPQVRTKTSWYWMDHPDACSMFSICGGLAQVVERSLSMWEVPGSIPGFSRNFLSLSRATGRDHLGLENTNSR